MKAVPLTACMLAGLAGCASGPSTPLPTVQSVCVTVKGLEPHEEALVMKRAATYLHDNGFKLQASDCGASLTYQRFGGVQAEVVRPGWIPFTVSRSGTWSQEGTVTATRGDTKDLEDYAVNLRGYASAQDLLDALAWQIVRPATWLYSPLK